MIAGGVFLPVLLLPGFGAVIAPPTRPEEGCPSARQVTEALQARVPEAMAPAASSPARADLLRAVIEPAASGAAIQFALVDARGEARLKRTLRVPARARGGECVALADTIAAIVERFLQGIEYGVPPPEVPPPPTDAPPRPATAPAPTTPPPVAAPPPPAPTAAPATPPPTAPPAPPPSPPDTAEPAPAAEPTPATAAAADRSDARAAADAPPDAGDLAPRAMWLAIGGGWRVPSGGQAEPEGRLGATFELTRARHRLALALSAGASPAVDGRWDTGSSSLRRFPLAAGVALRLATRPGQIEPSLAVTLDLLTISSTAITDMRAEGRFLRPAAGLEAALGYRLSVAGGLFIRPVASAGMTLTRYEVVNRAGDIVFRTPRVYAILGLEVGLVIR